MLGGKRGRSAGSSGAAGHQDRVRTHLFFTQHGERQHQKKKRRAQNKLHQVTHKKDEMVQVGELDPSQWKGNQRVLHFGPMAQRDPYFYYYPKGWDVLYPAHFGFFPYRTDKFRGSSSIICTAAFGVFMILGGCLMVYMGFFVMYDSPFWTWSTDRRKRPPPIQIAGPILLGIGVILSIISLIYSLVTSNFFKLYLHHTRKHDEPARLTTITTYYPHCTPIFEKNPYQPLPPPAYPVLENPYAHSSVVRPHDEMKLYPPVIPGCSTLSLHGRSPSNIFVASPYNTLRATSLARYHSGIIDSGAGVLEQKRNSSVSTRRQSEESFQKRSKSMGPLHRAGSNRSRSSAAVNSKHNIKAPLAEMESDEEESIMNLEEHIMDVDTPSSTPVERILAESSEQSTASLIGGTSGRVFTEVLIKTIRFCIPKGYDSTNVVYLGGGSYGDVVKCTTKCRDGAVREVTVKKLRCPFTNASHARRIYRELKLLQLMKHSNVIEAIDLYTPNKDKDNFDQIYLVTEYAGSSLLNFLNYQKQKNVRIFGSEHVKLIVYQILRALKYIHSANVIHRDLKPGNIAVTDNCDLRVLDFGLARSLDKKEMLTQYVMTRWYRSPEVIYWNIDNYNTQVDVWSVGCIAAELMTGEVLFSGSNSVTQYEQITKLVGSPDSHLLDKIERSYRREMRVVIESYEQHPRVDFYEHFKSYDKDFIDFLDKVLVLDPEKRMTVEEALQHPYMSTHYYPSDEPTADWVLEDDESKTLSQWKQLIWNELQNFEPRSYSPEYVYNTD
ncbi:unnamed protein product [Auanema sp. JU1783]|nr:unnamed protein product [Auanema sp. JU1783]